MPPSLVPVLFLLLLQEGCMAATWEVWSPHVTEEARATIRTIDIVVTEELPRVSLELPSKGALSGAGRKSGKWAGNWAMSALGAAVHGRELGLTTGAAMLVITPVVASAGAVYGAIEAPSAESVESSEAQVRHVLRAEDVIDRLQHHVRRQVIDRTDIMAVSLSRATSGQGGLLDIVPADGGSQADSMIRIRVKSIDLRGTFDVDPPLALHLVAQVTLSMPSATPVYAHDFRYVTGARRLTEWTANEAKSFFTTVDFSLAQLAELIVDDLLLIHPFHHDHLGSRG
jgi:hypothetical protein